MVYEIKNRHDCDCDRCDKQGEVEYHAYVCEICNCEFQDDISRATDCEEKHKKADDLLYGQYLYTKSREKLDKHAKLPGQKTL